MIAIRVKSESEKFSKDRNQLHFDRDQGEIREEVRELEISERSRSSTILIAIRGEVRELKKFQKIAINPYSDRDQGEVREEFFFK